MSSQERAPVAPLWSVYVLILLVLRDPDYQCLVCVWYVLCLVYMEMCLRLCVCASVCVFVFSVSICRFQNLVVLELRIKPTQTAFRRYRHVFKSVKIVTKRPPVCTKTA